MNTLNKSWQNVNPINRDLAVVIVVGFIAAMAIVTTGVMLLSQL